MIKAHSFLLILVVFLLLLCPSSFGQASNGKEKVWKKTQERINEVYQKYETDCPYSYFNFTVKPIFKTLRVFNQICPVYCSPDDKSDVVTTLHLGDEVRISEEITRDQHVISDDFSHVWYRVSNSEKTMFVKKEHLEVGDSYLNFLVGIKRIQNEHYSAIIVLKCLNDNKKLKDSIELRPILGAYKVEAMADLGLLNADLLIKYTSVRGDGAATYTYDYVLFDRENLSFRKLISYSAYYDDGGFDEDICYFPMRFGKKILLVKNADKGEIFDYQTGELNVFSYPKNLNIPINKLIVKIERQGVYTTDSNGNMIMDEKTGQYQSKTTGGMPVFYIWDGQTLKEFSK